MTYDLIVIGGGPGGYTAAIRGAQRGLKAALVEKGEVGGACLHRGCIPSKAYIAAAGLIESSGKGERMGVGLGPARLDFPKLVAWKSGKVKQLAQGLKGLLKGHQVELLAGEGILTGSGRVRVGDQEYRSRFVILATGSEPIRPPGFSFDGVRVVTSDELYGRCELPRRLLVVGGGVIGCEMASAFRAFGVEVTIAEMLPHLLPGEDSMISRTLEGSFEKRGIEVRLGSPATDDPAFDCVLVAVGRRPVVNRFKELGIQVRDGAVAVNDRMETTLPGVSAIGDLVGKTMLAHGAMAEGVAAVESMVGNESTVDYDAIPRVVYTTPEIASVGHREEDLKKAQRPYRVGRFSYSASGMALCHEAEEGFCQVLVGEKGALLGASIVGARASDLIAEVVLVMKNRLPVRALIDAVHAHPSFSEIVHEAFEDTEGLAIHKRSPRSAARC